MAQEFLKMVLSDDYDFLFFKVANTGSTSLEHWLDDHLDKKRSICLLDTNDWKSGRLR